MSKRSLKVLSAIGALAAFAHAGDYSTWGSYRPVTLSTSGMGLSAAVTNMPLLVRFNAIDHKDMLDSVGTQVQANGSDIRVTKADGTTDVPFEIEHLSTGDSAGALHLWILADNVPANSPSAATYRVYWGKSGQSGMSNPAAVFPTSAGFQAVFHLNDTGATIANSANPALEGTATGTSTTPGQSAGNGFVSAKGGARVRGFGTSAGGVDNGTPATDYIKFSPTAGHILSTHNGPLTMEGWIYSSITSDGHISPGTKHIVAHGEGNTGGAAWFARTAALDGSGAQNHYSAGGPNSIQGPIGPWGEQHNWQYVVAVWDGTNWTIYRQRESDHWNNPSVPGPGGMLPDSAQYKTIPGVAPTASTRPWYIGAASSDAGDTLISKGWQGWMDEVRISTVARDSNYVKLNFFTTRGDSVAVTHPVTIGPAESPTITGPYATWSGHRTITLNTTPSGADVATDVHNFPVLVRLGAAEASIISAANGGSSIRFSKMDNATPLPYQIESWSPTAAAIWVKVDTIKGNNSTQGIRMHWGKTGLSSESNGAAVFDTAAGFVGVWHMNGTTGETDATGNAFDAAATGTVPGTTGLVGGARSFSTTANYLSIPGSATGKLNFPAISTFTLSAWVYSDSITTANNSGHGIINKGNTQYGLGIYGNEDKHYDVMTHVNNNWRSTSTLGSTDTVEAASGVGKWRHVMGTWNGNGTPTGKIYIDGVLINEATYPTISSEDGRTTTRDVHIGVLGDASLTRPFDGDIDEVTASTVVRSAGWVKLTYENQKAVNSLVNIGLPQLTGPGAPTGVTAVADTAKVIISWTAPADNGGSPITGYKAMVVGDTARACTTTGALTCEIGPATAEQLPVAVNIVVRASNDVGHGPNSAASNTVTPIAPAVPSAPLNPSVVVNGPFSITVSWEAPASDGGAAITAYNVTGTPSGFCSTTGALTCTVTGLAQGTDYSFTVTASNLSGAGAASAAATGKTTGILGSFVIHMDGARNPYTYRLPLSDVQHTKTLRMTISDVQGKRIWTRTINPATTHVRELTWNGTTSTGRAVAPGLYVVNLKAELNGKVIESTNAGIKQ